MKRIVLSFLSLLAIAFICLTLVSSWSRPQEQTRLDLLQTDLLLQASEWQPQADDAFLKSFVMDDGSQSVYEQALSSYRSARNSNLQVINDFQRNISRSPTPTQSQVAQKSLTQKQNLINELDVRIGLLVAHLNKVNVAIANWERVSNSQVSPSPIVQTAQVLRGLWNDPIIILPDAEAQIRKTLDGWFRNEALQQLYKPQQRQESLAELRIQQQLEAEAAINRLAIINTVPVLGGVLGFLLLIILGLQRIFFPQKSPLKLKPNHDLALETNATPKIWQVPWDGNLTWEVIVLWFTAFVVMSQLILPIILSLLGLTPNGSWSYRDKAILVMIPYVLSMSPMLVILNISLKKFLSLPQNWFRLSIFPLKWVGWGLGGYLAAVPLVLIASVISQKVLQGQGGGNPLLPILVESQDSFAKLILWITLAIAAPFFEELLFRGFLLPSLTKWLPLWGAIALSAFAFATVHLNLADVLPLTVLGIVMGFVYTRSQNLLAPMLLHSLWNSGSFFALLALGNK